MISIILSQSGQSTRGVPQHMEKASPQQRLGVLGSSQRAYWTFANLVQQLRVCTPELSEFENQLCFVLFEQLQTSHMTSLCLGFLAFNIRMINIYMHIYMDHNSTSLTRLNSSVLGTCPLKDECSRNTSFVLSKVYLARASILWRCQRSRHLSCGSGCPQKVDSSACRL